MQSNDELLEEVEHLKDRTMQLSIIHDYSSLEHMPPEARNMLYQMVSMIWDQIEDKLLLVENRKHAEQ